MALTVTGVNLGRGVAAWRSPDWRPTRRWRLACAAASVAVLVFCGYGSFLVAGGEDHPADEPAAATVLRELSSRADDPRPLTAAEVFPGPHVVAGPSGAVYRVLQVQVLDRCGEAAEGELARLLDGAGCSQVVRATVRSADGGYVATAGLFNLADEAGAHRVHAGVRPMVDAGTGRFRGMPAGAGTTPLGHDRTQVGWHVRGHFLAYAVIARTDGTEIWADDPDARRVLTDLIETHLRTRVLDRRAASEGRAPS